MMRLVLLRCLFAVFLCFVRVVVCAVASEWCTVLSWHCRCCLIPEGGFLPFALLCVGGILER